jgi:class 3 adenylate cyclase
LFVDVKSSLELSASVALEDWWSMICGLFDLMCVGVHQFGGWIANFTGDGIAAIFDDRTKATAHAEQCCEAALWLRAAIKGPADRLLREYGLELAVRIGMHSGEILTGPVTGPRYRCYTASGFSVSLAKRIEGLALPGHIYISEDTAKLLPSTVELRSLGSFNVRGAAAPVSVFELLGVRR